MNQLNQFMVWVIATLNKLDKRMIQMHSLFFSIFLSLFLCTIQAQTLVMKIDNIVVHQQSNEKQLTELGKQAFAQNDQIAYLKATQSLFEYQLIIGDYDAIAKHIMALKQHPWWDLLPELKVIALSAQANKAYRQGKIAQATEHQSEVIALVEQHEMTTHYIEAYNYQGIYFRNLGQLQKAKSFYLIAKQHAQAQNDPIQVARITMNLGVILEGETHYNQALEYYKAALSTIKKHDDERLLGDLFYNITKVYQRLGNFEQALIFASKALAIDEKVGDINNLMYSYNNIAGLYNKQGFHSEALTYIDRAIELAHKSKNQQFLAIVLMRKALIYQHYEQLDNAIEVANLAAKIALEIDNTINLNNILPQLAKLYVAAQQYHKAIQILDQLPDVPNNPNYMLKKHAILAKSHFSLTHYQQAYQHLDVMQKSQQQVHSAKMTAYQDEMNNELAKFSEELKVKELELENQKQKSIVDHLQLRQYFFIAVSFAIFLLLSLIVYHQIKKRQMAQAKAVLKEAVVDHKNQMLSDICHELRTPFSVLKLQIEALQYNLEPNTDLAHQRLNEKIAQLSHLVSDIDQLSQADSMILQLNKVKTSPITVLNTIIANNQVLVEKAGLTLKQDIQLSDDVEIALDINRIQQVFHNLFSNSIRYTAVPGFIRIKARHDHHQLFIQIDDTSPGVSPEDIEHIFDRLYRVDKSRSRATGGLGLGLSICKSLIELHQGSIVAKHGKHDGLCIRVLLPLLRQT